VAAAAEIFTFNNNAVTAGLSAASAMSPSVYSNLASPFPLASPALLPMTPFSPPSVNRTLKPKTQSSGAAGVVDGPLPPPSVNRQLKPNRKWSRLRSIDFLGCCDDADLLFSLSSQVPFLVSDNTPISTEAVRTMLTIHRVGAVPDPIPPMTRSR
jgi:hypothetical protein